MRRTRSSCKGRSRPPLYRGWKCRRSGSPLNMLRGGRRGQRGMGLLKEIASGATTPCDTAACGSVTAQLLLLALHRI